MEKSEPTTFGAYVSEVRKSLKLSQKDLAQLILREDGVAISPQYLNDIEHDRRNPTSDHIIQQFAKALKVKADYLHYLSGKLPDEIRERNLSEKEVEQAFRVFRKGSTR